jgi:hypothetical protein
MSASVHVLHPKPAALAAFIRVGHTGQRRLEQRHVAGRFPYRRVAFEAAHIDEQADLLCALRASGCGIVLDPNFAEMATPGRYGSAVRKLPWANIERPWTPDDFTRERNLAPATAIADTAIKYGVSAVLAPAHLIETEQSLWWNIDLRMCEALRRDLDRLGGRQIGLDYQLIITNTLLKNSLMWATLIANLVNLPIQNVWLRVSGFGAKATGASTRSFIEVARALQGAGRPLIADFAGGFAGLGALAFGAVGGISHGIGQRESFDATVWKKPRRSGGRSPRRMYIPELDRYLTSEQLNELFNARGGKSRFACNDTRCCPHGIDDMVKNAPAHFLMQRSMQIESLSTIPEARRAEHFLLHHLDPAVRSARQATRLKGLPDPITALLNDAKSRLVGLRDSLGVLQAEDDTIIRSRPPAFRACGGVVDAVLGT